jgi:branched-chain amino acid aminotransferase
MSLQAWVGTLDDGDLVPVDVARVSVLDHGFTVADGVFETLSVNPSGAFAVSRHLRRLAASAAAVGLPAPDLGIVAIAVTEVVEANLPLVGPVGRLRITYTSGSGPLGSDRGAAPPTLVVTAAPSTPWPDTTSAITVPWPRNERSAVAGVKTTSYAENVVALAEARSRGASEALLSNTVGNLCEGTGTNVFVVIDGRVLTPSLSSGCLAGITRDLVLEWFGGTEAELPTSVLEEADEVFLTSSTRGVHPVVRLDEREWPGAGPVSRDLRASFVDQAAGDLDP